MAYYTMSERSVPGTATTYQRGSYFGMYETPKYAKPGAELNGQSMSVIVEDQPESIVANLFESKGPAPAPISTRRRRASLLPETKGRVKVAVRCRPPFEDELQANGDFVPVVNCPEGEETPRVELFLGGRSRRNFYFDYVFSAAAEQTDVYDNMAGPIVHGALQGMNGAIFAYGQTGTGKTYTMGILDEVEPSSVGIVPRTLSHVFGHVESEAEASWTVTMSFLQIYLETIHDLLAPSGSRTTVDDDGKPVSFSGLNIREDPKRGFYVEGLKKYIVQNIGETVELINYGLRNRVMAPTLMNTTSSRSHTLLTLEIEKTTVETGPQGQSYNRTLTGKLLLVDLAGSERVRRTTSQGTRLEEAKSINQSLSALGNVVAALADPNSPHVPFRDSKLTKLAQDSLGGNANTALIATIGPAIENNSETLSTLMFASRCMRLKARPVKNEVVDMEQLVSVLQTQLADVAQEHKKKEIAQQDHYEKIIDNLSSQIDQLRDEKFGTHGPKTFSSVASTEQRDISFSPGASVLTSGNAQSEVLLAYGTDLMKVVHDELRSLTVHTSVILARCCQRELAASKRWEEQQAGRLIEEESRTKETERMMANDMAGDPSENGPHLKMLEQSEAFARVERRYGISGLFSNDGDGEASELGRRVLQFYLRDARENPVPISQLANKFQYPDFEEAVASKHLEATIKQFIDTINGNFEALRCWVTQRDGQMQEAKEQIALQLVEQRQREEEVVNWSYVLKFLLATNSGLREDLRSAQINQTDELRQKIRAEDALRKMANTNKAFTPVIHMETPTMSENGIPVKQVDMSQLMPPSSSIEKIKPINVKNVSHEDSRPLTQQETYAKKVATLRAKAQKERERQALMQAQRGNKRNLDNLGSLGWVRRGVGAGLLRNHNNWLADLGKRTDRRAVEGKEILTRSLDLMRSFWGTTGEYLIYGDTTLKNINDQRRKDDQTVASNPPSSPEVKIVKRRRKSKIAQNTYSQLDMYMDLMKKEQASLRSNIIIADSHEAHTTYTGTVEPGWKNEGANLTVDTRDQTFSQMERYLSIQQGATARSKADLVRERNLVATNNRAAGKQGDLQPSLVTDRVKSLESKVAKFGGKMIGDTTKPSQKKAFADKMAFFSGKKKSEDKALEPESMEPQETFTPYKRPPMSVSSLTRVGGGGWLLRKRPDKYGKWDAMFVTFKNRNTVLSYIPLSLKGSIDLTQNVTVTDTIPADFMKTSERKKKPYSFCLISPSLKHPFIISAYDDNMKQEWMQAIKHAIHVNRKSNRPSLETRRRGSIIETALEESLLEGILEKKSGSHSKLKTFAHWNTRIFNLRAKEEFVLDYFDVKLFDTINPVTTYSAPKVISAHLEAVDSNINPIWFQKKCKFTFHTYKGALGGREDEIEVVAEMGTDSQLHRKCWVKAFMGTRGIKVDSHLNLLSDLHESDGSKSSAPSERIGEEDLSTSQKSETMDSFIHEISRHKNFSRSVPLETDDGNAVPFDDVNDKPALA